MSRFIEALADPQASRRFLVTLGGFDLSNDTLHTLYFSDGGFTTRPDDDPPNVYWDARIKTPLLFQRSLFQGGAIGGRSIPGAGSIVLNNMDGGLDYLNHWSVNGRPITVLLGSTGFAFADYGVIFSGTCDGLDWDIPGGTITVRIRDYQYLLDRPLQQVMYLGTGGTEGDANLAGLPKPLLFGVCRNVSPVYLGIISGYDAYQVHDGPIQDVPAVYDRGVPLARGSMPNPEPGTYGADTGNGIVYLGSRPAGTVTMDVFGDASGGVYRTTFADIARRVAADFAGLVAIDAPAFAAVQAECPWTLGYYTGTDSSVTISGLLDQIAGSVGGWWGYTRSGVFTIGRIHAPDPLNSLQTFDRLGTFDLRRQTAPPPSWRQTVQYRRNWTVMSADQIADTTDKGGIVDPAWAAFAKSEWRTVNDSRPDVQIRHAAARDVTVNALLDDPADAQAFAVYRGDLYGVPRVAYDVETEAQLFANDLGNTVTLVDKRCELGGQGQNFRILSMTEDAARSRITATVWG